MKSSITLTRRVGAALALGLAALVAPSPSRASTVIDNLPRTGSLGPLGEPNTAYIAQSFVVTAANELASRVTVDLGSSIMITGPDGTDFRVLLTETVGGTEASNPTGIRPSTVLFESATLTLPAYSFGSTLFTVDLGGIPLVAGATYAIVLDAFVAFDGVGGGADVGTRYGYADGHIFYLNVSGGNRAGHFAQDWFDDFAYDLAFRLETVSASAAVPEPSTLVMAGVAGAGLLGGLCWRRLRKAAATRA